MSNDRNVTDRHAPAEENHESFLRWQHVTITQLGSSIRLFLTFAAASLGFLIAWIKEQEFDPGPYGPIFVDLSALLLLISILLGTWCTINRLRSMRHTQGTARAREEGNTEEEIRERTSYQRLDKKTWPLFWSQVSTFTVAVLFLIVAFGAAYQGRLF
jgi:hypothetical protein